MVVLLDETGLDNHRAQQEFFGWLNKTNVEDSQEFWPDTLQIGRSERASSSLLIPLPRDSCLRILHSNRLFDNFTSLNLRF